MSLTEPIYDGRLSPATPARASARASSTHEAQVTQSYKDAIALRRTYIAWTNKLAGTNSSVIKTDQLAAGGLRVNALVAWLLRKRHEDAHADVDVRPWNHRVGLRHRRDVIYTQAQAAMVSIRRRRSTTR